MKITINDGKWKRSFVIESKEETPCAMSFMEQIEYMAECYVNDCKADNVEHFATCIMAEMILNSKRTHEKIKNEKTKSN